MKNTRIFSFIGALLCFMTVCADNRSDEYLKEFTSGGFRPQVMAELYSMNDGERYTMLSEDGTKIISYNYDTGAELETIFDVTKAKNCNLKEIAGYEFDPTEKRILIHTEKTPIYRRSFTTTYYVYTISSRELEPLSKSDEPQQMAQFSPNGRMVAFARNNNLFIKKLDFGTEMAVTTDGVKNSIINGTPDWVYEEEFGLNRCFEWSVDSKMLAWIRFDESAVKQFSFDLYDTPYDDSYTYKYPKAGETNSTVSLHVYDIENRTTRALDCGTGNNIYFPILHWTSDANALAVVRLNRRQTVLDLLSVNPRSGVAVKLLSESDNIYIDYRNYKCLQFNDDNSFVAMSECDGFRHVYLYNANGSVRKQLTSGKWDVTDFYGYDGKTQTLYVQAAIKHPSQRHVCKVDKKGKLTIIDETEGTHSVASISKEMKYIVERFNNTVTADRFSLYNGKGKQLRTIIDNKALQEKIYSYNLPEKEFFSFTTSENVLLHGWLLKPVDFDENREYPLVMVQYSGPDSQEALNRFKLDWEYYLSQNDYVVACVDGRGTGAKGREFRTCTYLRLGELETRDQIETAKYLGAKQFIDSERIAIWGWSFGGFMALNCLTYGDGIFKVGISVAPVTDWRLYNTAYTERYMATPAENDLGYGISELISKVGQMKGKLLLCHGTADDNVHFQQAMMYTTALVEAGIQFEMQIYPNKNHSILGAKTRHHLYTRFNDFLKNNL